MLKGFRSRIRSFFLGRRGEGHPVIMTEFGPVTESARLQAAMNIKADENIRQRVLAVLTKELGSIPKAEVEMRRRYPEAFKEE